MATAKKKISKKTIAKKDAAVKASAKKTVKSAKQTATKTAEAVETRTQRVTSVLRKGALAYVGLYGAAYERAKLRTEQVRTAADKARAQGEEFFGDLVIKGEKIEKQAGKMAKDAQNTVVETYEDTSEKVSERVKGFVPSKILPFSANDRVEELEAEVVALNKKISALSKKTVKPRKTVKMKTEKTVKAAPKSDAVVKTAEKDVEIKATAAIETKAA
jgi:hypothetical protein